MVASSSFSMVVVFTKWKEAIFTWKENFSICASQAKQKSCDYENEDIGEYFQPMGV